jgi:hypothetical protein
MPREEHIQQHIEWKKCLVKVWQASIEKIVS